MLGSYPAKVTRNIESLSRDSNTTALAFRGTFMNRKIVAILLSTFGLSSAGNALAQSPATTNAIGIGGGVHPAGSAVVNRFE